MKLTIQASGKFNLLFIRKMLISKNENPKLTHCVSDLLQNTLVVQSAQINRTGESHKAWVQFFEGQAHVYLL
jgi:hypothetical protein